MSSAIQYVVDGAALGSFFAIFALGIALIFGIMRLVNFAHGELIMVGSYAVYLTQSLWWPLIVLAAVGASVAMALITERVAFRPVRGASPATLLITSFAVSYLLQSGARPSDGSSRTRSRGPAISARAIASCCCSPPERLPAVVSS